MPTSSHAGCAEGMRHAMRFELPFELTAVVFLFSAGMFSTCLVNSLQTLFILGRREEAVRAFADCVTCFEVKSARVPC